MEISIPDLSIIVPIYKAEKYLDRCIKSILSQSYNSFELILVDDGSPDKSGDICDEYSKTDIRVRVFHKTNSGVSSARQFGLDHAIGKYVIHIDPDDWVEQDMLLELYGKAERENADMVICDFYKNVGKEQFYIKQQPSENNSHTVLCELFKHLHGSCWNKLIKRECLLKYNIRFDQELSYGEDLYFHGCLLLHNIKIVYLAKAYYHYDQTINPNSIISSYSLDTYDYSVNLLNKFMILLNNNGDVKEMARSKLSYLIIERTFLSGIFSSRLYRIKIKPYKKYVFYRGYNDKFAWLLFFSTIGCYRIVYDLYCFYKRLRTA